MNEERQTGNIAGTEQGPAETEQSPAGTVNGSGAPKKSPAVRILAGVGVAVAAVIAVAAWFFAWLTIGEYRPDDIEDIEIAGAAESTVQAGDTLSVVTWNTGYGALGDNADFFMDGGSMVYTADGERVRFNLQGIADTLAAIEPDVILLQEVDQDADRSHRVDEAAFYTGLYAYSGWESTFAYNYRVMYVPYPIPPVGNVNSGILTLSRYHIDASERVQLPVAFSWPVRLGQLKRCLLIDRLPVEGSDRELVLINLHLEAYDDGEGKYAQAAMLRDVLAAEAEAGNYVIAGGNFNLSTQEALALYPVGDGMWQPGVLEADLPGEGYRFVTDALTPTCRSLDRVYADADRETFQYYVTDGFILSANVLALSVETVDTAFEYAAHNPVVLTAYLLPEAEP